jgi:hypothetical protein
VRVDEQVVLMADRVFRWEGPKRKQTVIGAKLGRLALTDQRLLFLSTGKNDLTAGRIAASAATPLAVLRVSKTEHLDVTAADVEGGLDLPVSAITSAGLKGMFKYLVITYTDATGAPQASTFSPKNGGMPDGATWVTEIDRLRTQ